jgi:Cu/Ag efflux protein CusF
MNTKMNRMFTTLIALTMAGSSAASAQMTPPAQNQPPAMDKAPAQSQSAMPESKEIQGTIQSVDQAKKTLTLDDGTTLTIPSSVKVAPNALKKGAKVSATYEEQGGKRVVISLRVEPPSKS